MFVPQRPLAAPGAALWQQICYPDDNLASNGLQQHSSSAGDSNSSSGSSARSGRGGVPPGDAELSCLLGRVGLLYLLDRVGGSFWQAANWDAMLSPGELQRLAVARVLYRYGS
jgi:ABC-type uncharacterized transport system fused permease/ATPase subunit